MFRSFKLIFSIKPALIDETWTIANNLERKIESFRKVFRTIIRKIWDSNTNGWIRTNKEFLTENS